MNNVSTSPLPETALLRRYTTMQGAHTDCFSVTFRQSVSLETYAIAFLDSPVFRLERRILALAGTPSNLEQVKALASAQSNRLAAWHVEDRNSDQILLAVGSGPIRTWIMRQSNTHGTTLYFGSAVLPGRGTNQPKIGFTFRALMGFHRLYSRVLLRSAAHKLSRSPG